MQAQRYRRVYIDVLAHFRPDGEIIPVAFCWEDGRRYTIDKVLDWKRRHAMKAGGCGMRYTVQVLGQERYLFLEDSFAGDYTGRWFVEAPDTAGGTTDYDYGC